MLRDGGRVVLADVDYAGILPDTDEVEATDRVLGRCSASFLAAAAAWWQAMQEADSAAHGLVLAAPLLVAVGTATFGDG